MMGEFNGGLEERVRHEDQEVEVSDDFDNIGAYGAQEADVSLGKGIIKENMECELESWMNDELGFPTQNPTNLEQPCGT